MEFLKVWEIILRRKKTIIIAFSIIFGAMLIGTHLVTPTYEAKAKLLIEASSTLSSLMSSLGLQSVGGGFTPTSDEYGTDIALVTIRPLLEKLISLLNLKGRDGKAIKPDELVESSLFRPHPSLEVSQYKDTDMLEIAAYSTDPSEAVKMSNKLAEFYIEDVLERTREAYKAARIFIEGQIQKVQGEYYKSLANLKDFSIKEGTVDLNLETQNMINKIATIENNYENNEETIIKLEKEMAEAREKLAGMQQFRKQTREFSQNDQVRNLKTRLNELLVSVAEKSIDFAKEHPEQKLLEKEIETVRELIKNEAEMLFGKEIFSVDPIYDDLSKKIIIDYIDKKIALSKRNLLKQYLDEYQTELLEIPIKSAESSKLELALTVKRNMYQTLLEYMTQVEIAESMTISNIRMVEPAIEPETPDFPKKTLNYILGIFFGLFCGLMLAFFKEYIDNTVKYPDDLKHVKSLTLLGNIPKTKHLQGMNVISSLPPNSPVVEAYRTIRNSIRYASLDRPINTILITSSIESEGKSSLASNIALAFNMEGKQVILVDLDLRRPSIYKFFKVSNRQGITNILAEDLPLQTAIIHTDTKGVDLLTSGPIPPDPSGLIEAQKLKDVISALKEMYDMVIIDTPPAIAVNDAIVIGAEVDGVIFVVEAGRTTFSMVEHIKEVKEKSGINLLGVVLNKFRAHASGYYHYYYYNSYYKT